MFHTLKSCLESVRGGKTVIADLKKKIFLDKFIFYLLNDIVMLISIYLHVQKGMYFKTTFDVKSRAGEKTSSGSEKRENIPRDRRNPSN